MGEGLPAGVAFQAPPKVIIISESSAEATLLVRTGHYTTARFHSSAAPNNTRRYADAQPISVHTQEVTVRSRTAYLAKFDYRDRSSIVPR